MYWKSANGVVSRSRNAVFAAAVSIVACTSAAQTLAELEPNNEPHNAQLVATFGLGPGLDAAVDITGEIAPVAVASAGSAPVEDDGSITLAHVVALGVGQFRTMDSTLGDGPHGAAGTGTGDFDFYRIDDVQPSHLLTIDIDTPDNGVLFDSFVAIYFSDGELLASNDDDPDFATGDSFIAHRAVRPGSYFVCVGAHDAQSPGDPFDASTGPGAGSEGAYTISIGQNIADIDLFAFDLNAGEVFGGSVSGFGDRLIVQNPFQFRLIGTGQDLSPMYPASSPLPGGGNAVFSYVVPVSARYTVGVTAVTPGEYVLSTQVFAPVLENAFFGEKQILYLDFDGATVDPALFGGSAGSVTLSPLSGFLAGWGLAGPDEDALIDGVIASVRENLRDDILGPGGLNPRFDIEIRNSRDHADPWGGPLVSRVVIGGTIGELGVSAITVAQSVDPGNFDTAETALVLLDTLSAAGSNPDSLNAVPRSGSTTMLDLAGLGLGQFAAHAAGHLFGNFHTEPTAQLNSAAGLMDSGGDIADFLGVGVDGILGTSDDIDVDFTVDSFDRNEGFAGVQDTQSVIAFGLTTPQLATDDIFVDFEAIVPGDGTPATPFNTLNNARIAVPPGGVIHILPGATGETLVGANTLATAMTLRNFNPSAGPVRVGAP